MRRDLTLRSAAVLLLLTLAAILVHGYHPGAEDDFVYMPAIKHDLNPALYPHDADFFRLQLQATVFDKVVAASIKLTHAPLDAALLAWHAAAIFLVLLGCWKIARRCFRQPHAQWAAVTTIAALLTLPVAGTSLFLIDQHLHPRALATAFVLFAIANVLDRRWWRAVIWIAIGFAFHPIMAAFGASFCVFLGWPSNGNGKMLYEAKRRVHDAVNVSFALVPLGWIFEHPTAAWREAAATRDYYFLGKQEWYEWLGTFAPLAILWWFSRIGAREENSLLEDSADNGSAANAPCRSATRVRHPAEGGPSPSNHPMPWLCRRLIWFSLFQFAVTLAIMLPPQIERFRTLQPLRYLHLVYLLMFLIAGGLIGQYVLKAKTWRWALLFVPIAAGMFIAQRQEFPASAHIEIGRWTSRNRWERAFLWARQNTRSDAYFALGPRYYDAPGEDWHSFRAIAERGHLADALKDPSVSTQVPRLAVRWQRESHAQDGWKDFQAVDFARLNREFGVNWVVLDHEVAGLNCPYTDEGIRVCRVE